MKQCKIVFEIDTQNYIINEFKILLTQQYFMKFSYNDWNWIVNMKVIFIWMKFKKCLKKSLKNLAIKRQETFNEYLKLQQQKEQIMLSMNLTKPLGKRPAQLWSQVLSEYMSESV